MEEREQAINDLVDVIVGNLNNEWQHGHNSESDMISLHSDLLLENDNHIANSDMSLPSHLNSNESIELLPANQVGGSVAFLSKDEQQVEAELQDDDQLTTDVFNFPHTYFELSLHQTNSFKHKQHDLVNEQSYTVTMRENAISNSNVMLGDIHNQLYLMFYSLLEEIHNVYNYYDLIRIFITHKDLVNTNIVVGPDYLGNINADIVMNHVADVIHSNNFIPVNDGLEINVATICNIKGLNHKIINNIWNNIINKWCIITIKNDDELCLPHAIAMGIARAQYKANSRDNSFRK